MPSFHVISSWKIQSHYTHRGHHHNTQEGPHQKLFFDIKDKNYKKAKMKGGLGWMKNIGNDPARFLMRTIFLVLLSISFVRIVVRKVANHWYPDV